LQPSTNTSCITAPPDGGERWATGQVPGVDGSRQGSLVATGAAGARTEGEAAVRGGERVLAVAAAAGAHPTPPRGNGSEGGSTGRHRRRGSSSGAPVPLSLSPSLRWRQLWGTARWRRWWRGGGGRGGGEACAVCVCVKVENDLREKRLVECFCLPSA